MEDFQLTLDWANRDIGSVVIGIILGSIIFFVGRWVARLISRLAARSMGRAEVDPLVIQFAKVLIYTALLVAAVIAALDAAGIHTTNLTALLASAGLAIGIAVKDALSNFASGSMILLNKPYRKDDYVEAAGTGGRLKKSVFSIRFHAPQITYRSSFPTPRLRMTPSRTTQPTTRAAWTSWLVSATTTISARRGIP